MGRWGWEGGAVMGRRGSDGKEGTVMESRGTVIEGEDRDGKEGTERGGGENDR